MSGTAPAWISYAALGVAVFAALVALASACVTYLTYRANGPRLRLQTAYRSRDPETQRIMVDFSVVNQGRGDVSIVGFHLTPYGSRKPVLEIDGVEGPTLPHRMSGSSEETWRANVLPAAREYDAGLRSERFKSWSSWPTQFYFSVKAGNGKLSHAAAQYDAHRFIADAFAPKPHED